MNLEAAVVLERLEDAERRLEKCVEELLEAHRAIDDLNVQCKFWRQAAEHAVNGWNKLEDAHEALLEKLSALCSDDREEWAPPMPSEQTVDVGFGKMRIVEDETPLERTLRLEDE